jgi:hypothetical protein
VCAAVLSLKISQAPSGTNVAAVSSHDHAPMVTGDSAWSLSTPVSARDFDLPNFRTPRPTMRSHGSTATPRYVLDSTPVSYEASLRF